MSLANDLLSFIDASPTPQHTVIESKRRLDAAGFSQLAEADVFELSHGDKRYLIRSGTIIALEIGQQSPAEAGFRLIGAHTDSPNLRVKPNPQRRHVGFSQLGVQIYGSPLLHTWLDRDLALAGSVAVDTPSGPVGHALNIHRPLLRIPSLAIHLNRGVNKDGLKLNWQKHLAPVMALGEEDIDFRAFIKTELKLDVAKKDILAWDLSLYDMTKSSRLGIDEAFINAPRLDNLGSSHAALHAIIDAKGEHAATRVVALYDHEECGSRSAHGAQSVLLQNTLERVIDALGGGRQDLARAAARSFMVSADMAHAAHPNHADKHEPMHQPRFGGGPVIKVHANQSYATDFEGAARFEHWARAVNVDVQRFVTRTDLPCGSTIGPISAARLGMRTVDVGNPMLSMHSCREMCAAADVPSMIKVMTAFFEDPEAI